MVKGIKLLGVVFCLVAFSQNSNAQFKFSMGPDVGFVLNEGSGLSAGLSFGGEVLIGDNMGATFQTAYSYVLNDFDGLSTAFIPYMAGFKYYFVDNENSPYVHGQLGMTMSMASGSGVSTSSTNLSYAIGGGYLLNEHIDLGLRFHMISASEGGESVKWLALRAAYVF